LAIFRDIIQNYKKEPCIIHFFKADYTASCYFSLKLTAVSFKAIMRSGRVVNFRMLCLVEAQEFPAFYCPEILADMWAIFKRDSEDQSQSASENIPAERRYKVVL
jgi:hypothetical protein